MWLVGTARSEMAHTAKAAAGESFFAIHGAILKDPTKPVDDEDRINMYCNQVPCVLGRQAASRHAAADAANKISISGASSSVSRSHIHIDWDPVVGLYKGTLVGSSDIVVDGGSLQMTALGCNALIRVATTSPWHC